MTALLDTIDVVRVKAWQQYSWLRHGFSTRSGGVSQAYGGNSLNLSWTKEDDPESVAENRKRFVQAVKGESNHNPPFNLVGVRQIHSSIIHNVRDSEEAAERKLETPEGRPVLEGDGLITALPGVLIAVATADCVPVLVVDTRTRVVAAFHAGWRGTASRIVENGVAALQQSYGSRVEDLVAAIGPSIGPCCYSVGEELYAAFASNFSYADQLFHRQTAPAPLTPTPMPGAAHPAPENREGQLHLDLWEANRRQLLDAGLPDAQITVLAACTACARDSQAQPRYFSHREQRGIAGRMLAAVGILNDPLHGKDISVI
jgi:YfiH family protein